MTTTPQERRDGAVLALLDAGLTPREVAELRLGHVRIFENGRGGVRVAWRSTVDRSVRARYVPLDERQARSLEAWILVDLGNPRDGHLALFPSSRSSRLCESAIRKLRARLRAARRAS